MNRMEEQALEVVKRHPEGVTAKQVASELGWKSQKASRYLGTLFCWSHVAREFVAGAKQNEYVYRPKPPKIEAPKSQWQPEPRFAQSCISEDA
jgi:hypothetical protein